MMKYKTNTRGYLICDYFPPQQVPRGYIRCDYFCPQKPSYLSVKKNTGQTDGPTDGLMDGRTDTTSVRDA